MIPGQQPLVLDYKTPLPPRLTVGDSLAWSVQTPLQVGASIFLVLTAVIANVPTRVIIGGTGVAIDASGQAAFALSTAITEIYAPGKYQWVLFAVDAAGDRSQLSQGVMRIVADPAGANPVDYRTANEKLLTAIRALLQGKALDDTIMYKVGGRELTKIPIKDLEWWHAVVESRVRRARIKRGDKLPTQTVGITFGGR